jgi:glycosyltransferase involved in cell wall biosynthesis
MNGKVAEALEYCQQAGFKHVVLGIPFPLTLSETKALQLESACRGMVLYPPSADLPVTCDRRRLGQFIPGGDWTLPTARGTLLFVGSHLMLTRQMALRVLRTGRLRIICRVDGRYRPIGIYRFLLWPLGERLYRTVSELPLDNPVRKWSFALAASPPVARTWHRIFRREEVVPRRAHGRTASTNESLYAELCRRTMEQPAHQKISPVPGRIILVNPGLAAGGAERQIVNTLIGLKQSGRCESVVLLAEYIDRAPRLDFFLDEVTQHAIEVAQVKRRVTLAYDGLSSLSPQVAEIAAELPSAILEEVLNLVEEFKSRRPSVVHGWQDSSSIKAAFAALIAGVPRIVLGCRNVTPVHFTYFQEFMQPAYGALAAMNNVRFLNNSEAGAADYARWLGLPASRFVIVRNGLDLRRLRRAEDKQVAAYRDALGIPPAATVIGSIFRFWPEKRPMLWLQSAAALCAYLPNVRFLIIGEGPMRREMEDFVRNSPLRDRVCMPGDRPEVATPLSSMDLFVLTSEFEGTPNVVLEAQWLGLPVVATRSGGTSEAFEPGVSGLLADTLDPQVIASLAFSLLSDRVEMVKASQAGPRFVAEKFAMQRMILETLAVYGLQS